MDYPRPYGSYTLLAHLGAGGMSEVDVARRTGGDGAFIRLLCIKRIRAGNQVDDLYVRMFQDEARITAELSHENIAQVYDFGQEGEELYIAMEYVPGLDLRAVQIALVKQGKLLPTREALSVVCGVLRALQYAHTRVDQAGRPMGIVHRDVNPRNVMLSIHGEVKLIDFGVAKAADRLEKTEGNTIKGKYAYMAPEQIEGHAMDHRADLFAVGLVIYELLTGRSPFAGLTEVQILHRILSRQVPPLPDGLAHPDPALLRRIVERALAGRAEDRYPSAEAMRVELEAALVPLGGPAGPAEIAALLRAADPAVVELLGQRVRAWRDGASAPLPLPPRAPAGEQSGTLDVSSFDAKHHWMGWAAAGVGLGTALLLGVILVGGAAWWWISQDHAVPSPAPAPVAAPVSPVEVPPAPPEPAVTAPPPTRPTPREPAPKAPSPPAPEAPPPAEPVVAEAPPEPVAVAAPEPTESGFLNLTSRPVNAEVFVDGVRVGVTPLRLHRLPVGTHTVEVRDPTSGHSKREDFTLAPKGVVTLRLQLD